MHSVFLVEDHPVMRQMLREFLALEHDLAVCGEAGTGEEALERLAELQPDLALIDVSLPGISGLELLAELRARYPNLPCAVLSGHGERSYAERALELGARGYLIKGRPEQLPESIRRMVKGERLFEAGLV